MLYAQKGQGLVSLGDLGDPGDHRGEAAWPGAGTPFRWSWPWRSLCWEPLAETVIPLGAGQRDKEQRDEGQRLGQRPTESGRGRGSSQSSDILSFNGLKATEIPHRKRKGKRKGLGQMRVPCCLSVCLSGQTRHTETLVLCPLAWLF